MKNIQVIDSADNCVYDIFAATDEEFSIIFPEGEDVAFTEEVSARADQATLDKALSLVRQPVDGGPGFPGRNPQNERLTGQFATICGILGTG